jgi:hypothetical protein
MKEQPISKEEIKQLLFFMNRIKAFEKTFIIQKNTMTRLIWGLLLIGAGILDFVITKIVYMTESSGIITLLTLVPWLIAIFSGLIIQIFSDRHITNIYSWKKSEEKIAGDTIFITLGFILMGVVIAFTSNPDFFYLTFPAVALISGFLSLVTDESYFRKNKDILNQNLVYFIPGVCVGIAALMIISFMTDKSLIDLDSVIFGFGFGGSFCLTAFWNRKKVNTYIEQTDID